ncbi:hypothetical protein Tco_1258556 [Tanacetum coccineum]
MNMFKIIPIQNGFQRSRDLEGAGLERLKQQYKNDVELEYHVDQLKATVLTEEKWNNEEDDMLKLILFERHMSKNTKPHPSFYNNDFYYLLCLSTDEKRFDDKEYEFSYADLPRLNLNDVKDMVKDIQLGVESYQLTLDLTKPMMPFEGINQRISFIMTATHKGVVYLNQHNVKSLMRLTEVKKLCDGTLQKIRENLIDMVTKNKLGDKYEYIRNHKKTIKNKQARTRERKSVQKQEAKARKSQSYSQLQSILVNKSQQDPKYSI